MDRDYGIERRLARLDPGLHGRYRDCMTVSQQMLSRYELTFPDFTDHTVLHTLEILDFCNQLIGDQLEALTADDLYVLLMGALFHDVGMGVSVADFQRFCPRLGLFPSASADARARTIRGHHQEFSALYLEQYWQLLDIPNEAYAYAVIQVCRGHRKADLTDEAAYPSSYPVEEGRTVCLPYLAALVCLADELDVAADRNISFMYHVERMPNPVDRLEFHKHMAIRRVELEPDRVVLRAWSDDPEVRAGVAALADKLREKLLYCRGVAAQRSPFVITQKEIILDLSPEHREVAQP